MTPQYLIWSYEHDRWWRPGGHGYTTELAEAGRYSRAEAARIVAHANTVRVEEIAVPEAQAARLPATLDEAALIQQATDEMRTAGSVEVVLRPSSALCLASLLQLALRHPGVTGEPRRVAQLALKHLRWSFAMAPAVLEMLRRGDDPSYDQGT